jgi:hypothetical protein
MNSKLKTMQEMLARAAIGPAAADSFVRNCARPRQTFVPVEHCLEKALHRVCAPACDEKLPAPPARWMRVTAW